jgi:tRNA nucleotidyltransferase/poly(A) polymerase
LVLAGTARPVQAQNLDALTDQQLRGLVATYKQLHAAPELSGHEERTATRIAEDYLRILRFFRFHAAYGQGAPDPEGVAAAIAGRAGLDQLSRERVRMELFKLLAAKRAPEALAVMTESGLLDPVLGGVPLLAGFAGMVRIECMLGLQPDPVRRLGALGVLVVEDANRLRERLRVANVEHERLQSMADGWWRVRPSCEERYARVLLYRLGAERFIDRVLLAWARSPPGDAAASWHGLATLPGRWTAPVFPLRAADLIKRGLPKGPRLGVALAAAEEAWTAAGFPLDSAALAALADQRRRIES